MGYRATGICGTWTEADNSETVLPARELLQHWVDMNYSHLPPPPKKFFFAKENWMKQGIPSTPPFISPQLLQNVCGYLAHARRRQRCTNTATQNIIQPQSLTLSPTFSEDKNSGLHPHPKVVTPAPFPSPFFSPPPPSSLSFTHNKISLNLIQTWQLSTRKNSTSFQKV